MAGWCPLGLLSVWPPQPAPEAYSSFLSSVLQVKELGGEAYLVKADMSKVGGRSSPSSLLPGAVAFPTTAKLWLSNGLEFEGTQVACRFCKWQRLRAHSPPASGCVALQHDEIEAMVKEVADHWGGLDVLVRGRKLNFSQEQHCMTPGQPLLVTAGHGCGVLMVARLLLVHASIPAGGWLCTTTTPAGSALPTTLSFVCR